MITIVVPARAQEEAARPAPVAVKPPPNDPRKGPRLVYSRGPAACLSESAFRDEVAIVLDGVDHFDATSPDSLAVTFEQRVNGFLSTLIYTDAHGHAEAPIVKSYPRCDTLARFVASTASGYIPGKSNPAPPPTPLPDLPACEIRPACDAARGPMLAAWAPPPAGPAGIETFEVVAPPLTFLGRLRKMNVTIALGASALLGVGVAETVSPGVSLSAEMRGQNLSFVLELRGVPPGKVYARVPVDPSLYHETVEMDFSEWTGLLVPCFRYSYFVGCGVAQGGASLLQNEYVHRWYPVLNFGPRAGFEVGFGERFAVFGFAEMLVRAVIPGVDLVLSPDERPPANVRWDASPVAGFAAVGLLMKLN